MSALLFTFIVCSIALVFSGIALILTYYSSLRKSVRTKKPFTNEVVFGLFLGLVSTVVGAVCLYPFLF